MENLLRDATTDIGTRIDRLAVHVNALEHRMETAHNLAVEPRAFGEGLQAFLTRALILSIIVIQLIIGGLIAYRLGPEGYGRSQARANWAQFCTEMHKVRPEFVCPAIGTEQPSWGTLYDGR